MSDNDYSPVPRWKYREDLRGAKFSHFVGGLIFGALVCYFLLRY